MKNRAKFKLFRYKDLWFWSLYAPNNKIILQSEAYTSKFGAIVGTLSARLNSIRRAKFKKHIQENGEFYFTLTAMNNKVIGVSEGYKRKDGRENGIDSVQKNAPTAALVIEDK